MRLFPFYGSFPTLRDCLGLNEIDRKYYVNKTDINPATGKMYAINPSTGAWDDNYWAQQVDPVVNATQKAQQANQGNQQAITDALTNQTNQFNQITTSGKQDITDFLTKYSSDVPSVYNSTYAKYNIPGQLDYVGALNNRIKDLQGNQTNEGAGGFSSAGQVDAAINSRYLPLYETGVTNLANSSSLANTEAAQLLQPDVTAGNLLNDRLAREMTGFTSDQQNVLQGLIANLNAGVSLTNTQLTLANNLALKMQDYNNQLSLLKQQQAVTVVPASSNIYNAGTGQFTNTPGITLPGGTSTGGGTRGGTSNSSNVNAGLWQELGLLDNSNNGQSASATLK